MVVVTLAYRTCGAGTAFNFPCLYVRLLVCALKRQEAQLSPRDRAMLRVSWNLANCHATVQKLLVRQVLNQVFSLIDACDKIVLDDL